MLTKEPLWCFYYILVISSRKRHGDRMSVLPQDVAFGFKGSHYETLQVTGLLK